MVYIFERSVHSHLALRLFVEHKIVICRLRHNLIISERLYSHLTTHKKRCSSIKTSPSGKEEMGIGFEEESENHKCGPAQSLLGATQEINTRGRYHKPEN